MRRAILSSAWLFLATAGPSANAVLHISDDFDYANGSITTVSSGAWFSVSSTTNPLQVVSGQAVVTHGGGSRQDVGRNVSVSSGDIYYGLDFSVDDPGKAFSGTPTYFAHYLNTGAIHIARIFVAAPNNSGGDFTLGVSTNSSSVEATWASDLSFGTTYRAVVGFNLSSRVAKLWINPTSIDDSHVTGMTTIAAQAIANFSLRQDNSGLNSTGLDETIRVDRLRVATTFEDVLIMGVPEAGSFLLVGFVAGGMMLAAGRRRNLVRHSHRR